MRCRRAGAVTGTLYLLPSPLAALPVEAVLPATTIDVARALDYFLAENARSARAFLKALAHPLPMRGIEIVEIGHAPPAEQFDTWLRPLLVHGRDGAIVAEAGCPGIADPGATLVARAHELGIAVRPLVGPSSLLLALMASGLEGQRFRFVGYLPQDAAACAQRLRELEDDSRAGETQLFIETPYRNERLFAALLEHCAPTSRLCVAVNLTATDQSVHTRTVAQWRALDPAAVPALQRRPAVFLLLADPRSRSAPRRLR